MSVSDVITTAPDYALISPAQLCVALGISRSTLDLMEGRGEAPPKVQISPRRIGYQIGPLRRWLAQRSNDPTAA